ncbi:transducin beta-like protein 3 [Brevipalpus obovatus]|uniref:transducin beta-like protein 3 n=1 Tax=Brevipalpus obovatus TaxID=246614 RepID=UPI003D9E02B7
MVHQKLKKSFEKIKTLQPFFMSGNVKADLKSEFLLCSNIDSITVLSLEDGEQKLNIHDKLNPEDVIVDFVPGFRDDNRKLFTACRSGLLKEFNWSPSEFSLVRTWKAIHDGPIITLAINGGGEGNLLASGGSDSVIKIWDTSLQYCIHHLKGCRGIVSILTFQEDSSGKFYIAACGELDNIINIWDLDSPRKSIQFEGHSSRVVGIQFIDNGEQLVLSGSRDMLAIVWSLKDKVAVRKIPLFEAIESFVYLPHYEEIDDLKNCKVKGSVFLTGGAKGLLKAWDTATGNCIYKQENPDVQDCIQQCLILPNGEGLTVVTSEKHMLLYDLKSLTLTKQFIGNIDQVYDAKFVGSDENHIVVATNSPSLKIFRLSDWNCSVARGHKNSILSLQVFASNPEMFASSSKDNDIRVWKFSSETMSIRCLYIATGHSLSVTSIVVPFKSLEYLYSASEDTTIKVWKIPHCKQKDSQNDVQPLASLETIKAHEQDINCIAISSNDKYVCSCSQDKTAKLWRVDKNLSLVGVLRGHKRGIWSASFSPVDLVVATSSADTTVKIWSLNDLSCIKTLQGHDSSILGIVFVNQGMQLLSSASDGNMKLWLVKTGECTLTIDGHSDKIWALSMNRSEKYMITGSEDSHISVWKDDTEDKELEAAKEQEQLIIKEQKLANLILSRKWTKALTLAIKLGQPFRALSIVNEILVNEESDRMSTLTSALEGLRDDQLIQLLNFAVKWNTNSKHSEAAHSIFCVLLYLLGPEKILNIPDSNQLIGGWLSYTKRHVNRLNRLKEQASILEFLYAHMRIE